MSKDGFSYNSGARITLARAKAAKRNYFIGQTLIYGVPVVGMWALIVFTPPIIWGPIVGILGSVTVLTVVVFKGEDILRWWSRVKDDYRDAKELGVRDD